jgi:YesN/AraC family two-component response regulator
LKSTDKSTSEIPFEVGYNDLEYFAKAFTKTFGVNPAEYRRK